MDRDVRNFSELAFFIQHDSLELLPSGVPDSSFLSTADEYSMTWMYHSLFDHPSIEDVWVVSTFWLLPTKLL